MASREPGFTLIELLIVVAIIGLIAAIAVPNFLLAIQRGKQKQTMAEIRSMATAVSSYSTDANHFPVGTGAYADVDTVPEVALITPDYLKRIPTVDSWNAKFQYGADAEGNDFAFTSLGKGSVADTPGFPALLAQPPVGTQCFENDIVWANSGFLYSPEGKQRRCS